MTALTISKISPEMTAKQAIAILLDLSIDHEDRTKDSGPHKAVSKALMHAHVFGGEWGTEDWCQFALDSLQCFLSPKGEFHLERFIFASWGFNS
jgi:hypothetical protein